MSFGRQVTFADNILILDGLTGTGKTLFAPLLASMEKVQLPRFEYMVEYLCIAASNHSMNEETSKTLLNLLADSKCYDGMISRETNFRPKDLSSASSNRVLKKYIKQLFMSDGDAVLERKVKETPTLSFVTHQLFSCKKALFNAFDQRVSIIEMVRHPYFLVEHWLSYQDRMGVHSRDLTLCGVHQGSAYPWFAEQWKDEYINSNDFERVLLSITRLMEPIYTHQVNQDECTNTMVIPFEKFVLDPWVSLNEITLRFNLNPTSATKVVMHDQKVPRSTLNDGPQKPIYKRYGVKKEEKNIDDKTDYMNRLTLINDNANLYNARPSIISEFMLCAKKYEDTFGLWFK